MSEFNNVPNPEANTPSGGKGKKILPIIFIIVAVIALALAAVYAFLKFKPNAPENQETESFVSEVPAEYKEAYAGEIQAIIDEMKDYPDTGFKSAYVSDEDGDGIPTVAIATVKKDFPNIVINYANGSSVLNEMEFGSSSTTIDDEFWFVKGSPDAATSQKGNSGGTFPIGSSDIFKYDNGKYVSVKHNEYDASEGSGAKYNDFISESWGLLTPVFHAEIISKTDADLKESFGDTGKLYTYASVCVTEKPLEYLEKELGIKLNYSSEIDGAETADTTEYYPLYAKKMQEIYDDPKSLPIWDSENEWGSDSGVNYPTYSVADINGDGIDELLIKVESDNYKLSTVAVYTYNQYDKVLKSLGSVRADSEFYNTGYIKTNAFKMDHFGDSVFPFDVERCYYDGINNKCFFCSRDLDCCEQFDSPDMFVKAEDYDNDGVIYYCKDYSSASEKDIPFTKADFDTMMNHYFPEGSKVAAEFQKITPAEIEKLSK